MAFGWISVGSADLGSAWNSANFECSYTGRGREVWGHWVHVRVDVGTGGMRVRGRWIDQLRDFLMTFWECRQVDVSGGSVGSFSVPCFEFNLFGNEGTADSVLQNVANTLQTCQPVYHKNRLRCGKGWSLRNFFLFLYICECTNFSKLV